MALTIFQSHGCRLSLYSSGAGHSALVHRSGVILGFARVSRKEGIRAALEKGLAIIDKARREDTPQAVPIGLRHRNGGRPRC